jgi:asparagine synthetase B (glutamine-hydrolysing)
MRSETTDRMPTMAEAIPDFELFLSVNYVPNLSEGNLDWLNCDPDYDIGHGADQESWLVSKGIETLKSAIESELAATDSNALHVLPLSGGLDSGTLLAGLLEHLPPSQLVATTFGVPGTWDFEIPQMMAKKFGFRHVLFNLLDESWDLDQLARTAALLEYPVNVHQSYVRRKMIEHFGSDCVFWSGALGEIADKGYPSSPPIDRASALNLYFELHEPCKYRGDEYWETVFNYILTEAPWERLNHPKFDLERQYTYGIGEMSKTWPIVMVPGFKWMTPFKRSEWINFAMCVPYQLHYHKYLFRRIVCGAYKQLAELPSMYTYGMPLKSSKRRVFVGKVLARASRRLNRRNVYHVHPRSNYMDWGEALRREGPFQTSVYTTLDLVGRRGIVSQQDIGRWWSDHVERRTNNAQILMNLSSLELLLQAGKIELECPVPES